MPFWKFGNKDDKSSSNNRQCEPCDNLGKQTEATFYCQDCDENLCKDCLSTHKASKSTRGHEPFPISEKLYSKKIKKVVKDKTMPGQPIASNIKADSMTLTWEPAEQFGKGNYYQVSYKDKRENDIWRFWPGEFVIARADLEDIQSNSIFIFRVRVVYQHGEGTYSPESAQCCTVLSPASKILHFAKEVDNSTPKVYGLPTKEVKIARNNTAKTKKLEIGSQAAGFCKEKTIMLVGATGTGKSLLIDGMVNYVLGVNWSDPFRFRAVELEREEKERLSQQALSQTEWITCYGLNPEPGSRLNYRLNVIDTPGFGDTRGLHRDQEIVEQIRQLFSEKGPKGVLCLDAVCFLTKAPDARLTAVQTYIFHSIMSLFGKDIENNICSLITFADGRDPPVLAALDASKLPFGKKFRFNNSGVFANNIDIGTDSISRMFWNMGKSSFKDFFNHLDTMATRSLQLTKDVLDQRFRMEATIKNVQPVLNAGLTAVEEMKEEVRILEENKAQIVANAKFEYEVRHTQQIKTPLPTGQYVTNCTPCTFTCHDNCCYANDKDKAKCMAMDNSGQCKVCPKKCHWTSHANTPYIFEYRTTMIKKTFEEMQQRYQEASGKLPSQQQVVEKMTAELNILFDNIDDMMEVIKECNEILKKIALSPNPLSMTEHIDMMISAEEQEKKEGFQQRIKVLHEFRQRAEISAKSATFVRQRFASSIDVPALMTRMAAWFKK